MATFKELKEFTRGIKPTTEAIINGKSLKGTTLKAYLISKLTHPSTVEIEQPAPSPSKPSKKDKE
jgi:hypothetical protein